MSNAIDKVVGVKVLGQELLDISKLKDFQGELKRLSKENYEKLKKVILKQGFSEPVTAWFSEEDNTYYILNGHQRIRTLSMMRSDGYLVPEIPVNLIQCENREEAKKLVLSLTSQYGEMTAEGLSDFAIEVGIDLEWLNEHTRFAEVDLGAIGGLEDFSTEEQAEEAKDDNDNHSHKTNCPVCGYEFSVKLTVAE